MSTTACDVDDTPRTDFRLTDTEEMHVQVIGTQMQTWVHAWVQYGNVSTLISCIVRQDECCN